MLWKPFDQTLKHKNYKTSRVSQILKLSFTRILDSNDLWKCDKANVHDINENRGWTQISQFGGGGGEEGELNRDVVQKKTRHDTLTWVDILWSPEREKKKEKKRQQQQNRKKAKTKEKEEQERIKTHQGRD